MDRTYRRKKKKKNVRKIRLFRLIFILAIISSCVYLSYKFDIGKKVVYAVQTISKDNSNQEGLVDGDSNKNSIKGQTLVEDKDGYTMTFTTINSENKKTYKEYKQNVDSSWSESGYWGGTMRENGCGITSIATIASGYGSNLTPDDLREEYYPHLDSEDTKDAFKELGIKTTDFFYFFI